MDTELFKAFFADPTVKIAIKIMSYVADFFLGFFANAAYDWYKRWKSKDETVLKVTNTAENSATIEFKTTVQKNKKTITQAAATFLSDITNETH